MRGIVNSVIKLKFQCFFLHMAANRNNVWCLPSIVWRHLWTWSFTDLCLELNTGKSSSWREGWPAVYFLILHNGPFVSKTRPHARFTLHLLNSWAISQVNGARRLQCSVLGVIGLGLTVGWRPCLYTSLMSRSPLCTAFTPVSLSIFVPSIPPQSIPSFISSSRLFSRHFLSPGLMGDKRGN